MVQGHRLANLGAELRAGNFSILSGVSVKNGGGDEGPNPHELVEAALAACTIITVQMYANRKEWPLISTDVTVRIESEGKDTVFSRKIRFEGDLSEDQRGRLLEIADKCPIHNLLQSNVTIKTSQTSAV